MNNKNKLITVIGLVGKSDFMKVENFPKNGETVLVKEMHIEYGGKGINQGIAARRMNSNVCFITKMGNDEIYLKTKELLEKEDISYHIFKEENGISAEACIMTNNQGDNEVICFPGKNVDLTKEEVESLKDIIQSSEYLLLQFELSLESLYTAITLAEEAGVKVILNPAPYREIDKKYLDKCFLLTPNEDEAIKLFGLKELTLQSIKMLPYDNVIITMGSKGALVKEKENCYKVNALKIKEVVDTTGAGDTFNGALASALLDGKSLKDAIISSAIPASGLSVTKKYVLDAIPTKKELEDYLKNI